MHMNDVQQISLSLSHSHLYERSIHAESMAANIQGICAMAEVNVNSVAAAAARNFFMSNQGG